MTPTENIPLEQEHDGVIRCSAWLGIMDEIKIKYCREHWQHLSPHIKERATAKHLLAALEIAERLLRENNKLEMENRTLRMMPNNQAQRPERE